MKSRSRIASSSRNISLKMTNFMHYAQFKPFAYPARRCTLTPQPRDTDGFSAHITVWPFCSSLLVGRGTVEYHSSFFEMAFLFSQVSASLPLPYAFKGGYAHAVRFSDALPLDNVLHWLSPRHDDANPSQHNFDGHPSTRIDRHAYG